MSVVFHNRSNYDYHFLIRELANEFEGKLECLGEITGKYHTFSVPVEKQVTEINKDCDKSAVTISYKKNLLIVQDVCQLHYQIFANNLTEGIHKIKCKYCDRFLEYESI